MNTIYIIGNGFDRHHELKTSYWDFRCYLEKYNEQFLHQLEHMFGIGSFEKRDKRLKKNKEIQEKRDNAVFDRLWKSFEESLSKANEEEMLDASASVIDDLYLDGGPVGITDTMDQYWEEEYRFISELNLYVKKWIKQVRINKAEQKKASFINNKNDGFITFNYTNVLEKVYGIESNRIIHIHGGLPPYCNIEPVMGHGNEEVIEKYKNLANDAGARFDEGDESIYKAIANFYERTYKNTGRYVSEITRISSIISNADIIEVIGHSFGEVDWPYFRFVNMLNNEETRWKFYCFNESDKEGAKKLANELELKSCLYSIENSNDFWDL